MCERGGNDMEMRRGEMTATRGFYHTNAGYRIILATLSIQVRSLDSNFSRYRRSLLFGLRGSPDFYMSIFALCYLTRSRFIPSCVILSILILIAADLLAFSFSIPPFSFFRECCGELSSETIMQDATIHLTS